MTKTYYLAGPMTGLPKFNIPLFEEVARLLRSKGLQIISPAELDSEDIRQESLKSEDGKWPESGKLGGETWGDILARDVKLVADSVDGIVLLPGWQGSRGARLEAFVGLLTGKDFYFYNPDREEHVPVTTEYIREWIV